MLTLNHAEIHWNINRHCQYNCSYCHSSYKGGSVDHSVDKHIAVIEKLQASRYKHHDSIYWKIGGGEPLHFSNLSSLFQKMKERPCNIRLDTSGGSDWFSILSVIKYVDIIKLTVHEWQEPTQVEYVIDQCIENNVKLLIIVPLLPGKIIERRKLIEEYNNRGLRASEQILQNESGGDWTGYHALDIALIYGRSVDWAAPPIDPTAPDPNYVDLSIVNNRDPVYTNNPCYAGVDWIYISQKGWPAYSQCRGRAESNNVFDDEWLPPDSHFPCNMNQCKSRQDREKIRVIGS